MFALNNKKNANQKSKYLESEWVMICITLSGGLQDAYTYCMRDNVFANAQTGNIVLMMGRLFQGEFGKSVRYLVPLVVFAMGVLVADQIRIKNQSGILINSSQMVILIEIALLFVTGFIPNKPQYNLMANSLVSFCCAMQIETFKKVNDQAYASTMCIGNIRSAMESMSEWLWSGSRKKKIEFLRYILIIFVFAMGAGAGMVICNYWGIHTIIISSFLLFIAFILLSFK